MGYKESPVDEARHHFAPIVRHLWCRFVAAHRECLARSAGGSFHLVVPVPSTARPTGAPLAAVDGLAADAERLLPEARWSPGVLARSVGAVGHMHANPHAFTVPDTQVKVVARRRVLLLDDTYVSGARSQSAAAALRLSGASSVVIVALGRVLRPDRSPLHADFVRRNRRGAADRVAVPEPCCRCVQTAAGTE
jgi:hypothetical protein